jgi:hypothetical protein
MNMQKALHCLLVMARRLETLTVNNVNGKNICVFCIGADTTAAAAAAAAVTLCDVAD